MEKEITKEKKRKVKKEKKQTTNPDDGKITCTDTTNKQVKTKKLNQLLMSYYLMDYIQFGSLIT